MKWLETLLVDLCNKEELNQFVTQIVQSDSYRNFAGALFMNVESYRQSKAAAFPCLLSSRTTCMVSIYCMQNCRNAVGSDISVAISSFVFQRNSGDCCPHVR